MLSHYVTAHNIRQNEHEFLIGKSLIIQKCQTFSRKKSKRLAWGLSNIISTHMCSQRNLGGLSPLDKIFKTVNCPRYPYRIKIDFALYFVAYLSLTIRQTWFAIIEIHWIKSNFADSTTLYPASCNWARRKPSVHMASYFSSCAHLHFTKVRANTKPHHHVKTCLPQEEVFSPCRSGLLIKRIFSLRTKTI